MTGRWSDDADLDSDLTAWLERKARALTQGRVELVVAQLLAGLMEEERERRRLGLEPLEPAPRAAWGPLWRERVIRAE
ncbi:hypothetical protein AB0J80_35890 [Actinoplanes sp. NPDC049548]|uniref:hypothetical protein n=1 Tax=Actinoplanes sp. NPDC049548 TaxID=3155152 RepID=UPI00342F3A56